MGHDHIFINPKYSMGYNDDVDTSSPIGFGIHCVRLSSPDAVKHSLAGSPLSELPSGSVIFSGDVLAPAGSPLEPIALGSSAIASMDDALSVVARAFKNPRSILNLNGFKETTPIYIWHKARAATRAITPTLNEE